MIGLYEKLYQQKEGQLIHYNAIPLYKSTELY